MNIPKPLNENYSAVVVTIRNKIPMEGYDKLVQTDIFGNKVIIGKDVEVGECGLYFPAECQIDAEFLYHNNLYRHSEKNKNPQSKGMFEDNGRVRAIKLKDNVSQGFFIGLHALDYVSEECRELPQGSFFDEINGHKICKKYVIKTRVRQPQSKTSKQPKISRLVNNQFRFQPDTSQMWRNLFKFAPERKCQITTKYHGTSGISSRILCAKRLNWFQKICLKLGLPIETQEYDNIYSSRKVVKNDGLESAKKDISEPTKKDIWSDANDLLKDHLSNGMTIYYEIVGYTPSGAHIQKGYDYGCKGPEHDLSPGERSFKIFVYRITLTNTSGEVFEFQPSQIQMWCHQLLQDYPDLQGIIDVVRPLFEGYCKELLLAGPDLDLYGEQLMGTLADTFDIEEDCDICKQKVPREGIVVRLIDRPFFTAYKLKGDRFYQHETKMLDQGENDMDDNVETNESPSS